MVEFVRLETEQSEISVLFEDFFSGFFFEDGIPTISFLIDKKPNSWRNLFDESFLRNQFVKASKTINSGSPKLQKQFAKQAGKIRLYIPSHLYEEFAQHHPEILV